MPSAAIRVQELNPAKLASLYCQEFALCKVKQGETIRLVVKNGGKLLHELVLGTMPELLKHYEWMKKFPDMEHDEPHMAHLKPGASGEIVWQFTKPGDFHFACLIPGHLEAGMKGKITVLADQ